jgi:hypothetical protein
MGREKSENFSDCESTRLRSDTFFLVLGSQMQRRERKRRGIMKTAKLSEIDEDMSS